MVIFNFICLNTQENNQKHKPTRRTETKKRKHGQLLSKKAPSLRSGV